MNPNQGNANDEESFRILILNLPERLRENGLARFLCDKFNYRGQIETKKDESDFNKSVAVIEFLQNDEANGFIKSFNDSHPNPPNSPENNLAIPLFLLTPQLPKNDLKRNQIFVENWPPMRKKINLEAKLCIYSFLDSLWKKDRAREVPNYEKHMTEIIVLFKLPEEAELFFNSQHLFNPFPRHCLKMTIIDENGEFRSRYVEPPELNPNKNYKNCLFLRQLPCTITKKDLLQLIAIVFPEEEIVIKKEDVQFFKHTRFKVTTIDAKVFIGSESKAKKIFDYYQSFQFNGIQINLSLV